MSTPLKPEEGVFFWFNSEVVSQFSEGMYGSFAYRRILPYFSPRYQRNPAAWSVFWDGDCLPQEPITIPCQGEREKAVMKQVEEIGPALCFIVAVFSSSAVGYDKMDFELTEGGTTGYLGRTGLPGFDRDKFVEITQQLSLPIALRIDGAKFKKISFGYLADAALRDLGFETIEKLS